MSVRVYFVAIGFVVLILISSLGPGPVPDYIKLTALLTLSFGCVMAVATGVIIDAIKKEAARVRDADAPTRDRTTTDTR